MEPKRPAPDCHGNSSGHATISHHRRSRISDRGTTSFNMNSHTVIIVIRVTRTRLVHLQPLFKEQWTYLRSTARQRLNRLTPSQTWSPSDGSVRIRPDSSKTCSRRSYTHQSARSYVLKSRYELIVAWQHKSVTHGLQYLQSDASISNPMPVSPIRCQYLQYDASISNTASMEQ
jgi:hypothetical protein